jgi:glycerol-3-phosphate dehydrogenase
LAFPYCSPGTSSKSTKLVHGGVRYLQKAIFELDYGTSHYLYDSSRPNTFDPDSLFALLFTSVDQYKLVREALHERKVFLETAPYLSKMLPFVQPLRSHKSPSPG